MYEQTLFSSARSTLGSVERSLTLRERERGRTKREEEEGWNEGAVPFCVTEQPADQSDPGWAGLRACPAAAPALSKFVYSRNSSA